HRKRTAHSHTHQRPVAQCGVWSAECGADGGRWTMDDGTTILRHEAILPEEGIGDCGVRSADYRLSSVVCRLSSVVCRLSSYRPPTPIPHAWHVSCWTCPIHSGTSAGRTRLTI